jgi:putative flippase GtrA
MVINYRLNYRHTFRSDRPHREAAPRFVAIAVCTGILNALLVHAGTALAGLNYLAVQVTTTVILFFANYALNLGWTFRGSRES